MRRAMTVTGPLTLAALLTLSMGTPAVADPSEQNQPLAATSASAQNAPWAQATQWAATRDGEHALETRESLGFDSDPDTVYALATSTADVGTDQHGFALTEREAAEYTQRVEYQQQMHEQIIPHIDEDDVDYAGMYFDHSRGGTLWWPRPVTRSRFATP